MKNIQGEFLKFLKKLSNLRELDVSYNQVEVITKDMLKQQTNLETLNLKGNKIILFESNAVDTMDKLQRLDLRDNNLKFIEATALVKQSTVGLMLYLEGNPLECNCNIENLKDLIQQQLSGQSHHLSMAEIQHSLVCHIPDKWQDLPAIPRSVLVKDLSLDCTSTTTTTIVTAGSSTMSTAQYRSERDKCKQKYATLDRHNWHKYFLCLMEATTPFPMVSTTQMPTNR